jgi:hypothetical protein
VKITYRANFDPEKESIRQQKAFFWDESIYKLISRLGPAPKM